MEKKRVAVFIDGSNLYYKLRDLGITNKTKYFYKALALYLTREDGKLTECNYYVGVVRARPGDRHAQKLRKAQQRLFHSLMQQGLNIHRGQLMQQAGTFHEKGVDVQIAVDMIIGAYEDRYDRAVLLSSDTDLIPAVKEVVKKGKEVEYVGFAHKPTLSLQKHVNTSRLLLKEEVEKFMLDLNTKKK